MSRGSPPRWTRPGVDAIEVAHGDGLAGGSLQLRPGAHTDWEWIEAVAEAVKHAAAHHPAAARASARSTTCERAHDLGVTSVRIATHCTEADIAAQHIAHARELGMDVSRLPDDEPHGRPGALAAAGQADGDPTARTASTSPTPAAGSTWTASRDRFDAYRACCDPDTAARHPRPSQPVARRSPTRSSPSRTARPASTPRWPGMGAGAGNCPIEPFVAAADLQGLEARLRPVRAAWMPPTTWSARCRTGRCGSTARRSRSATPASTPASCATPRRRRSDYGVDTRAILVEVGRRRMVGGQEDMIVDVALDLAAQAATT